MINTRGLHARPASQIAKTAAQFQSQTKILKGTAEADAKSVLSLLILAAGKGTVLTLSAQGEDRALVLDAIEELFLNRFNEE